MSKIETRIRKVEQCIGSNEKGDADAPTDEERERLRATMRMAIENRMSVADLLAQSPCERRQIP